MSSGNYEQMELIDTPYMVTAMGTTPRVKDMFSNFHGAYLWAYQVCEKNQIAVDIAYRDKYILLLKPGNRTVHM